MLNKNDFDPVDEHKTNFESFVLTTNRINRNLSAI